MPGPQTGGYVGLIQPMLATSARELPSDIARWAAEFKWDGMRAVTYSGPESVRVRSRVGRDVTPAFPELAALAAAAGSHCMILDGEIVAFDQGRPSFAGLQRRIHTAR